MYNATFINELKQALNGLRTIHAVGEEWCSYIGKIPVGGVPYCGQEVTRETYSALWSYAQAQGLVKTESEWQTISTNQNGNVPFYSDGDGSSTFRMPRLVGYVRGASSQVESGSYVKEGLPNIEGDVTTTDNGATTGNGAFYLISTSKANYRSGVEGSYYFDANQRGFDASRSNAIYGSSSHVTPETSCVLFGVYAFGEIRNVDNLDVGTLTSAFAALESNVDSKFNGVVRSVNGTTADASGNVTISLPSPTAYVTETWKNGSSWYRKWSDGWVEQGTTSLTFKTSTQTFTLPIAMADTNYSCVKVGMTENNNYAYAYAYSTTQVKYKAGNGSDQKQGIFVAGYASA